jgi:3-isopropylmalate/(R)-2-methylmalate dehydratase small subunit
MEPLETFTSKFVSIPVENIDTDQITPARFLKVTTKTGLGKFLFYDWRYDSEGNPKPDFILNQPIAQGRSVLVAGGNFGCGSSREHAPWALHDFGFRAVISTSIADIFRSNALKNGLLPIEVDPNFYQVLLANPETDLIIDLNACQVKTPEGLTANFKVEPFARYRLLNGIDELDFLLQQEAAIQSYEKKHN